MGGGTLGQVGASIASNNQLSNSSNQYNQQVQSYKATLDNLEVTPHSISVLRTKSTGS